MAVFRVYSVKGVGPTGEVVELLLIADTELDAKRMAEATGLRFVAVGQCSEFEDNRKDCPPSP